MEKCLQYSEMHARKMKKCAQYSETYAKKMKNVHNVLKHMQKNGRIILDGMFFKQNTF